jgi:putative ABC transport system permease protein
MIAVTWLSGLLSRRRGRLVATALGVATAVALLASIGTFLSSTTQKMTQRAIHRVPVDWQVEAQAGTDPNQVLQQVRTYPGVTAAQPVRFAPAPHLVANTAGSVQTTGAARVVGLPPNYQQTFPGEIRLLSGSTTGGALLAQQTASNLHARAGDQVKILVPGGRAATVRVAGVVDLPAVDSLFQQVGAPVGSQPHAPPDNIVLLPLSTFDQIEQGAAGVRTQVHATLTHNLPHSPSAAFDFITAKAHNLEAKLAGTALVGNNIGSALDTARKDALYAQILFLFLGVPGAIIAALITASIAGLGADRRRREQALLRTRGATTRQLVRIALGETLLAAGIGIALGLGIALLIGNITFGAGGFGASTLSSVLWAVGAGLAGLVIAAGAITLPAWREARSLTVAGQRRVVGRSDRAPWWARYGVDFICIAGSAFVFWQASQNGYQLVLVPEGVPQVSVNWYALLAPLLGWIGIGLLTYRLADVVLRRRRKLLARALRPVAGRLSSTVAASMGRERRLLGRALALVALSAAFAASTAIFNDTYKQQAEVDARLTNGADVTVTQSPGATVGPEGIAQIKSVPGVGSIEPLQHRFAYVGADLQDLYGVRPQTIGKAGALQNGWFRGGTVPELMQRLQQRPDGLLVSEETVKDFQLNPGDLIRLRLQNGRTKQFTLVPFHYVGIAKEFPTAPRDSFFIANHDYIAKQTGSNAIGTFLVQTNGTSPATVAHRLQAKLGPTAQVTDIQNSRKVIGSNLTAVELSGLTRVELAFALILAIAATGLTLAVSFHERRRTFAIASALGARSRQLGGFIWSESLFVTGGGLAVGALAAAAISWMLIKVLTGVFDPPPDILAIPWGYLIGLVAVVCAAVAVAGAATLRALRRPAIEELRDL